MMKFYISFYLTIKSNSFQFSFELRCKCNLKNQLFVVNLLQNISVIV